MFCLREDHSMIAQMNDEIQAIECMTVVGGLPFVPTGASPAGFRANLKCHGARDLRICVYKGTRFFNGDRALVIKRWLHRVDEDSSGLTFEEWNPAQVVGG